jgi:hypothetical protein
MLFIRKEDLELSLDQSNPVFMSRHWYAVQSDNRKRANNSFEYVSYFLYLGTAIRDWEGHRPL